MNTIEAKEAEKITEKSFFGKIKDRFAYDIKKMDILRGKYDIDKRVILSQNALIKALVYSSVVMKTQGYKEIMGWLAGKRNGNNIEIIDAYVGNCESSMTYTELDPLETIKLRDMAKSRGLVLCGQWHLHPGFSTMPSGTDNDFMNNCEKMGMKSPVQLIVSPNDFTLTMWENGKRKNVEFIVPPKTDTWIGLNLGYINKENNDILFGAMSPKGIDEDWHTEEFYRWLGNWELTLVDKMLPVLNLRRFITWDKQ